MLGKRKVRVKSNSHKYGQTTQTVIQNAEKQKNQSKDDITKGQTCCKILPIALFDNFAEDDNK